MPPLSPESLLKLRRLRQARRLWRDRPLFAFVELASRYPGYTYPQFLADLRPRKRRQRHRVKKSSLQRYGRYHRMCQLLRQYHLDHNPDHLRAAACLRKRMTQSYRMLVRSGKESREYDYPATIPIEVIEKQAAALNQCSNLDQADQQHAAFLATRPGIR